MAHFRILLFAVVLCALGPGSLLSQQVFEVNLNDRSDDSFKVTLYPRGLSDSDTTFQFASTAPGTYEVMDIGRFVDHFKAFDKSGNEVASRHRSTNQWTVAHPSIVRKITYTVADIWDANVEEHPVLRMCSTTLSNDFVMINGQGVFGFFTSHQTDSIWIRLLYPPEWKVGTALTPNKDGYYVAEDFDRVVDSPFYLGNLSVATASIGGAAIDVFTYSKTGLITSDSMLVHLRDILKAESDFTKGLPVDRYVFLFYFGQYPAGAWEHSYCSEYVMSETPLTPRHVESIVTVVAHEFFHVNIPLNIHSELVEHFNFVRPVMSQHLWFYEGTTEWAARILQLRDSLITLDEYLRGLQFELNANDAFDQSLSLTSLGVHSTERQDQYVNIYQKGALVSTLLDIRLLKLSHGKTGLRELILELSKIYGKKRAFNEEKFFDELVAMTYPETRDFIDRFIRGTDRLPVREYFDWLGISYSEIGEVDSSKGSLGVGIRPQGKELVVTSVFPYSKSGLTKGDVVKKIDDTLVTFANVQSLFARIMSMKPGSTARITVERQGKETDVDSVLGPRVTRHAFAVNPDATAEQKALREMWRKNM